MAFPAAIVTDCSRDGSNADALAKCCLTAAGAIRPQSEQPIAARPRAR